MNTKIHKHSHGHILNLLFYPKTMRLLNFLVARYLNIIKFKIYFIEDMKLHNLYTN